MQKLWIRSAPEGWAEGLKLLKDDLSFTLDPAGLPLTVSVSDGLTVRFDGKEAILTCREKVHFFRGTALLLHALSKGEKTFTLEETPGFERTGAMFDMSRNAVLKPGSVKTLLRKMACMGLNAAMLYTEDTYEVPGYPYFGYMRGAYSAAELKELDDYAFSLGIELIPCIQTLGHLKNALRWEKMQSISDTASVLLCDDEKTYRFIEAMITSITGSLRSKRIHVGMDEAMDLGLGRFLQQHGYENGFSIIRRHLNRVMEILRRHGLHPMMWSDMYFRLASKTGDYYDLEGQVPKEVIETAPKDMDLVYWDYYHEDEGFYEEYIKRHKEFPGRALELEHHGDSQRSRPPHLHPRLEAVPEAGRGRGLRHHLGRRRGGVRPDVLPSGAAALCGIHLLLRRIHGAFKGSVRRLHRGGYGCVPRPEPHGRAGRSAGR